MQIKQSPYDNKSFETQTKKWKTEWDAYSLHEQDIKQ